MNTLSDEEFEQMYGRKPVEKGERRKYTGTELLLH